MKPFIIFAASALLLTACGKGKFETKPHLKLISVGNNVVPVNGSLRVLMQFTDKQGDVSDTFYITKQRLNSRVVETIRDQVEYPLPKYPKTQQGDIEVNLGYQNDLISAFDPPIDPATQLPEPDTLNIKFVVGDKAGNKSDTLTVSNIIVLR